MPWGVAAAAVSAGAGLYGSSQASKKAQHGADTALGEQRRQYDTTRADNQTALDARNYGLAQMQNLAGNNKPLTAADVMATPGYQFGLSQGTNSLNQNAAATGGLYSGAQLRGAAAFGTNYGTTKYQQAFDNARTDRNDQFDQFRSLATGGQTGANAINAAGQNAANNNSNLLMQNGATQGNAALANANTISNFANQAGSGLKSWFGSGGSGGVYGGSTASGAQIQPGSNYNYGSVESGWADGGPVTPGEAARREPMVGTMGPSRDGGGGNLSSKAILDAILRRQAAKAAKDGVGALPVNPLMDPGGVLRAQEQSVGLAQGGPVHGPGGPREDAIPARLSNGEHVFDVASVNALGDGDNALGQQRLNMLRAKLHGAQ